MGSQRLVQHVHNLRLHLQARLCATTSADSIHKPTIGVSAHEQTHVNTANTALLVGSKSPANGGKKLGRIRGMRSVEEGPSWSTQL